MKIDDTDTKILQLLQIDSRQSARELSFRLKMSTVTVLSRIKKLEECKIIQGYSVCLDHEMLGYDITTVIEIKTSDGKMLEIESEITKQNNVIAVYDIT